MRKPKNNKIMKNINRIGALLIIGFLVFWLIRSLYKNFQFKNDFEITIGQVSKITTPGWKSSGDYSMLYEYTINGKKYVGNNNYTFVEI